MPSIGMPELIIIMVIILLVFGAGRLSEVGASLGRGIREFRNATSDLGTASATPAPAPALDAPRTPCRGCGHALSPSARFCAGCGLRVEAATAASEQPSA